MTASSMSSANLGGFVIRHRFLVLLLLGMALYIPPLGTRDMWYPDEPDIAEVAQAMYVSGDWIAPRRMGEIWVDYPPMLYWAGVASAHALGGVSEFAFRLPNALTAIALVLIACAVASRWFDPRTGLWAGFLLLTFLQFAYEAVNYRPDLLFSLGIVAGLLVYAEGAGDRSRWYLRVAGFALLGFAMLSKGPLGLLLPGLVLTLWHGSRREWRRILELAPLALVALAVYVPWFVACARAMGTDNILYELYAQNLERVFSGARGHGQPIYYYLVQLWIDLLPWGPLVPFAAIWAYRSPLRRNRDIQLLFWWIGAFVVFLSMAVTKRQVYLLPTYVAIALILAPWIASIGSKRPGAPSPRPVRVYTPILTTLLAAIAIGAIVFVVAFEPIMRRIDLNPLQLEAVRAERGPLIITAAILLAGAAWIFQAWKTGNMRLVLQRIGLFQIPLYAVVLLCVLPALNPAKSYRAQGAWILEQIGDESHFGLVYPRYGKRKMGAFGLYTGRLVDLLESREQVETYLIERPDTVVLIHERSADEILDAEPAGAEPPRELRTGRDRYLVVGGH